MTIRSIPVLTGPLVAGIAGWLLLVASVAAQTPPPDITSTETETVLVDVTVNDRKGQQVTGLTAADFQIWEDDTEQAVDGIFVESEALGPTGHFVVLLFDNSSMTPREQALAQRSATAFINANASPNRIMAVVNLGARMRVTQTFTDDPARLRKAVQSAPVATVMPDDTSTGRATASYAADDTVRALANLVKSLEAVSGRKSLIFYTAGFPVTSDRNRAVQQAAIVANRSNVAIFPVNVQIADIGLTPVEEFSPQIQRRGIAIGGGIVLRGVPSDRVEGSGNTALEDQAVMFSLAEATGGFVVRDPDDEEELVRIGREQNEYYILSYSPPASPPGSCHEIRVKVLRPNTDWRARSSYCRSNPEDLVSTVIEQGSLEDRAFGKPGAGASVADIAATMQVPYFYTYSNVARVHAVLEIDPSTFEFKREDGMRRAELEILGIARFADDTGNGSVAARFNDSVKLAFRTEQEVEAFLGSPYLYENQFEIASGEYDLAVAFTGGGAHFGKVEQRLNIAPYDTGQFSMSGIALAAGFRDAGAPNDGGVDLSLDSDLAELLFDEEQQLVAGGVTVMPAGSSTLKAGIQPGVYIEIYEPILAGQTATDAGADPVIVAIQMTVMDRGSQEMLADTGLMRLDLAAQQGNPTIKLPLELPVQGLPPGDYRLEIEALDSADQSAIRSLDFEIPEAP